MFPPMLVDEERDEEGNVTRAGQEYYLKAMNCPMHNLIFRSRGRSYRELPLRFFFEMGHDYRYEKSGVVHGLTRMRGFAQDDSHTYCTREQAPGEIKKQIEFFSCRSWPILASMTFTSSCLLVRATARKKEKFIGSDEDWQVATDTLDQVCRSTGLQLVPDPGGAAFYGPKVSVQVRDAIGRTWQMSTIQYDFNQPERFDLEYAAADGTHQRPIMLHSAKLGSVERFIGVLTEHYAGAFPVWLSPVQVRLVPVAEAFNDYVTGFAEVLGSRGIRVETDLSSDRFGKKIRNASKDKVPFILIAGGEDAEAGAVSFRLRDGSQVNGVVLDEAVRIIAAWDSRHRNDDPTAETLRGVVDD
ncbi:threonyl-tRNA synthetase [Cutibacterium acnes JCM 18918]|nr:threonyl-tRNA synthetase [Cutibacterium acnes JCM 18918]